MKKFLAMAMLAAGIAGTTYAQEKEQSVSDKVFDLPDNYFHRRFTIDLGKGNKMQVEVNDMKDLDKIANMDSLLTKFLGDIAPLKDSLSDDLYSRRIDYTIDSSSIRKFRIQQFAPKGGNYTVNENDVTALKLDQDTVHFKGTVRYYAKYTLRKGFYDTRHYRLSFFLNDVDDLKSYIGQGLGQKISSLQQNVNTPWKINPGQGATLIADPNVSARAPKGWVSGDDYLTFRVTTDIQNYKNYFVPSFSVGAALVITTEGFFKRDITMSWDPHFVFTRDPQNKLRTQRNDFLTLTYGHGMIEDNNPHKESHLMFIMSFSYLVHRSGEVFEKNTMRIGAGRLSLFRGKTRIEPAMYFNNLFKGVTPSIRLLQAF